MKGARAFTDEEIKIVLPKLSLRDQALFVLGIWAGFRISELLSLRIADVFQGGKVVDEVSVARRNMKKKREGRTIPLHPEAKPALGLWVNKLLQAKDSLPTDPLFPSREGDKKALHRKSAWCALTKAYSKAGLTGKLGTHALRKTFANRIYENSGHDLMVTQEALGHAEITSTTKYLSVAKTKVKDAILKR